MYLLYFFKIKKKGESKRVGKEEEKVIKRIVTSWAWFVDTLYCCLSFFFSLSLSFSCTKFINDKPVFIFSPSPRRQ